MSGRGGGESRGVASPAQDAVGAVLEAAHTLARAESSIHAIALVGSCARGTPGPDSDVDLVVLTNDPEDLCGRQDWFAHFGSVHLVRQRQFGDVTERRLRRNDGVEIEVGLAPLAWARTVPLDPGTARVVAEGFSIVLDPEGTLAELALAVKEYR